MPRKCCYPDCDSRQTDKNVSFHLFRGDEIQRAAWVSAIGRLNWIPSKNSLVCSKHFTSNDYLHSQELGCKLKACLKEDAVPLKYVSEQTSAPISVAVTDTSLDVFEHGNRCIADENKRDYSRKRHHNSMNVITVDENPKRAEPLIAAKYQNEESMISVLDITTDNSLEANDDHVTPTELDGLNFMPNSSKRLSQPKTFRSKYVQVNIKPNCHVKVQTCMGSRRVSGCQTDTVKMIDVAVQTDSFYFDPIHTSTPCHSDVETDCVSLEDNKDPFDSTYSPSFIEKSVYRPTELSEDDDVVKERKFIVFESCLLILLKYCFICFTECTKTVFVKGTMAVVKTVCSQGHHFTWYSQTVTKNKTGVGNVLLGAAILFSGLSVTKGWRTEQNSQLELYRDLGVTLAGDGRCDSPGFSAKYGVYSFVEPNTKKVLHIELVQSNEVGNSVQMEKEGLRRGLNFFHDNGISITCLITDRHIQVRSMLKKDFPNILHRFDCWHLAKGIKKKIASAAKSKGSEILLEWSRSIINHLYWSASSSPGDPELLVAKWVSLLHHICDEHSWNGEIFSQCLHEPYSTLERRKWLDQDSDAFTRLKNIVTKSVSDVKQLSTGEQTSCVEGFHSVIIGFASKSQSFSYEGMLARTYLAALHFNENGNKAQAIRSDQELRYSVAFPKAKKGGHTVRPIKEKSTYEYVDKLIVLAVSSFIKHQAGENLSQHFGLNVVNAPPPLASQYIHPEKNEAVKAHVTRFNKN